MLPPLSELRGKQVFRKSVVRRSMIYLKGGFMKVVLSVMFEDRFISFNPSQKLIDDTIKMSMERSM